MTREHKVLSALSTYPRSKAELMDELDLCQSTLDGAIRTIRGYGWDLREEQIMSRGPNLKMVGHLYVPPEVLRDIRVRAKRANWKFDFDVAE